MKNLMFSLAAVAFLSLSSFTTKKEEVAHDCTYNMYNSSGQFLGQWTLYDVPDNISCGSKQAKSVAIASYNAMH